MAEAMENLKFEKTERNDHENDAKNSNNFPKIDSKIASLGDAEKTIGMLAFDAWNSDLFSLNKSLYNSSKLFPPTEPELKDGVGSSRKEVEDAGRMSSQRNLMQERRRLKKQYQESISFLNVWWCFRMY